MAPDGKVFYYSDYNPGGARKQQIDIKDIPIATITSQYLEFMDQAREMDIDLGAEFVYMAATLIHIKSKMLLPRDPALGTGTDEAEDPRQELVERLLEAGTRRIESR